MIDLHCHFLPGLDDGAASLADGLALAQAAADDGIEFSMLTPHIRPGRYANTRSSIEQAFADFRRALRQARIPLHIGMAAEVRLSLDLVELFARDELPFLGELDGYRILLLEFPDQGIPHGAEKLVDWLLKHRIRPLIAHPERNREVIRDVKKLTPFVELGCFLQLTAGAVVGRFGRAPQACSRQLLESDVFKVLATDAHNLRGRRPLLREGVEAAAAIIGERPAADLVNRNPRLILRGAEAAVA